MITADHKAQIETAALKVLLLGIIGEMGLALTTDEGNAMMSRLREDCRGIVEKMGVDVENSTMAADTFRKAVGDEADGFLRSIRFND